MAAAYIHVHFRLDFLEANNMSPDQNASKGAAWEQSDMGPYCLQYRLLKNISR